MLDSWNILAGGPLGALLHSACSPWLLFLSRVLSMLRFLVLAVCPAPLCHLVLLSSSPPSPIPNPDIHNQLLISNEWP